MATERLQSGYRAATERLQRQQDCSQWHKTTYNGIIGIRDYLGKIMEAEKCVICERSLNDNEKRYFGNTCDHCERKAHTEFQEAMERERRGERVYIPWAERDGE